MKQEKEMTVQYEIWIHSPRFNSVKGSGKQKSLDLKDLRVVADLKFSGSLFRYMMHKN